MNPIDFAGHQLALLLKDHPVIFAMVVVPFVTVAMNAAIYFLTSPRWDDLQAHHPRLAALLKIAKAFGIDPVSLAKAAYSAFTGRVWTPPTSELVAAKKSGRPPPMSAAQAPDPSAAKDVLP